MNRRKLTIGLFGFGCVGFGLYEVLNRTPGLKTTIKKICVKHKNKERALTPDHFTFDKEDILNDDEINVVVELIDDADAAFEIVKTALRNGKAVVTANKKMIAEHFAELMDLQLKHNVPVLYEAACCASIPIIRNLEEYYDTDLLESVEGVVNGATNYILTKITDNKISYEKALKEAQEHGYAESNPSLDTCGFDSKYKLLIIIAHAFGLIVSPDEIFNIGIENIDDFEMNYAREKGLKIKLVAHAEKTSEGKITSFVLPKFVDVTDKLYYVDDVFNGVKTKSVFSDTQFFSGKGAGAHPTASAVLSDISALTYDYRYEYKKIHQNEAIENANNIRLKVLLRHESSSFCHLKKYFSEVRESYINNSMGYIIGTISLEHLKEIALNKNYNHSFVLFDVISQ